jgi:DNA processing protein
VNERLARIALGRLGEPGDLRLAALVADLGAVEVHRGLLAERDLDGLESEVASRLRGLDPAGDLAAATAKGIRFVVPGDEEWPESVRDLQAAEPVNRVGGPPLGLWVKGPRRLDECAAQGVAVVGSRSATTYGTSVARDVGAGLAESGRTIVSGAAFGIDQAAHRGALAVRGSTIAVLACGVDRAYPAAHKDLLDYIADTGLVVSELPPGAAPTRSRFLARNRLIAALSHGTVVVEAAVRSGALNTANWASRLNRMLMGVPGPVTSAPSAGVHELLRAKDAQLVTSAADVLELVTPSGSFLAPQARGPVSALDHLTLVESRVYDALPVVHVADITSVARTSGLAVRQVSEALGKLEEIGLAQSGEGGWRIVRA